jgi:hypothetical protein
LYNPVLFRLSQLSFSGFRSLTARIRLTAVLVSFEVGPTEFASDTRFKWSPKSTFHLLCVGADGSFLHDSANSGWYVPTTPAPNKTRDDVLSSWMASPVASGPDGISRVPDVSALFSDSDEDGQAGGGHEGCDRASSWSPTADASHMDMSDLSMTTSQFWLKYGKPAGSSKEQSSSLSVRGVHENSGVEPSRGSELPIPLRAESRRRTSQVGAMKHRKKCQPSGRHSLHFVCVI